MAGKQVSRKEVRTKIACFFPSLFCTNEKNQLSVCDMPNRKWLFFVSVLFLPFALSAKEKKRAKKPCRHCASVIQKEERQFSCGRQGASGILGPRGLSGEVGPHGVNGVFLPSAQPGGNQFYGPEGGAKGIFVGRPAVLPPNQRLCITLERSFDERESFREGFFSIFSFLDVCTPTCILVWPDGYRQNLGSCPLTTSSVIEKTIPQRSFTYGTTSYRGYLLGQYHVLFTPIPYGKAFCDLVTVHRKDSRNKRVELHNFVTSAGIERRVEGLYNYCREHHWSLSEPERVMYYDMVFPHYTGSKEWNFLSMYSGDVTNATHKERFSFVLSQEDCVQR